MARLGGQQRLVAYCRQVWAGHVPQTAVAQGRQRLAAAPLAALRRLPVPSSSVVVRHLGQAQRVRHAQRRLARGAARMAVHRGGRRPSVRQVAPSQPAVLYAWQRQWRQRLVQAALTAGVVRLPLPQLPQGGVQRQAALTQRRPVAWM